MKAIKIRTVYSLEFEELIRLKTDNYSYKKISCKLSNGEVVEYKTNFNDYFSK